MDFIALHEGDPFSRLYDIDVGLESLQMMPKAKPVRSRRADSRLEYRRHNAAQFVIVYIYFEPDKQFPDGLISIRAIRHGNVEDVFRGVRDLAGERSLRIYMEAARSKLAPS